MTFVVLALILLVGVGAGVLAALAVARSGRRSTDALMRELRSQLDQVVDVNRELGAQQRAHAEEALAARERAIGAEVAEMRADARRVAELVQSLDQARREKQGALDETLAVLATTTRSLSDALASPKARGSWGERTADDLLRVLGLREGVAYQKQKAVQGGRSIPDFTFFLPDGRLLHMDVKFPIDSYLRYLQAESDLDRERHVVEFLRAVRLRVKELTTRDYIDPERNTVQHVLCFVPNESVFGFICERGSDLLDEALRHGVVLCSPSTLYAVLAVVRQAAEMLQVERTSDEVLRLLGAFDKQWDKFVGAIETVGKRLESTQRAFDDLNGPRRRQLEKPLGQLDTVRRDRGLPVAAGYDDDAPGERLRAVGSDDAW